MCPPPRGPTMAELIWRYMREGVFDSLFELWDERERQRQDELDWADWVGV